MSLLLLSSRRVFVSCLTLACCLVVVANAQGIGGSPSNAGVQSRGATADETPAQLRERLPAGQRQQLDDAVAGFQAGGYADALVLLNQLRERHPRDPILAKFVAEASLNVGEQASALAVLKPLVAASPVDWMASALLARACAESGDAPCRDTEIAHMLALHAQGCTPPSLQDYIVEHTRLGDNTLTIYTSLAPYSMYKIYAKAMLRNAAGKLLFTVTLESNDIDQPAFAKRHPTEAAAGARAFSLDGYAETGNNSAGQRTQTHYTFKFLDEQPTYGDLREQFLTIASGKASPMSSRSGLIAP